MRDHRRLQAFTYTSGLAAIVLLLLPLLPGIGRTHQRRPHLDPPRPAELPARRGRQGAAGASPSPATSCCTATPWRWPAAGSLFVDLPRGRDLGPILAMWLVCLGILVFQRDLGSSLLFFGLFLVMLYVATERPGWLVVGGVDVRWPAPTPATSRSATCRPASTPGCTRSDPDDNSYQIVQGLYGMAWGGLVGRGLGQGDPQITPLAYSDFIVPSLGEELGLTGVMAVLLLYGLIVERGLRTALICRDDFGKLMATGLAVVFALQVFVVVGGVTQLIPLTGLTTPFLSYGGSQPGRQLGDRRAAAAHLRPGPPPTAGAGRARRGLERRHPGGDDLR